MPVHITSKVEYTPTQHKGVQYKRTETQGVRYQIGMSNVKFQALSMRNTQNMAKHIQQGGNWKLTGAQFYTVNALSLNLSQTFILDIASRVPSNSVMNNQSYLISGAPIRQPYDDSFRKRGKRAPRPNRFRIPGGISPRIKVVGCYRVVL